MVNDYRWECPYSGCEYQMLRYTEESFIKARKEHMDFHLMEIHREREQREQKLSSFFKKPLSLPEYVIRDYNKLHVTWGDIEFLITRGIRIDEDIEWNGYNRKFELPKSEH